MAQHRQKMSHQGESACVDRGDVQPCRLLEADGAFLADGTALIERTGSTGFIATVHGLTPIGPVLLAIFGSGDQRFRLELPDGSALDVSFTASRWRDGGRRVCFFTSIPSIERAHAGV